MELIVLSLDSVSVDSANCVALTVTSTFDHPEDVNCKGEERLDECANLLKQFLCPGSSGIASMTCSNCWCWLCSSLIWTLVSSTENCDCRGSPLLLIMRPAPLPCKATSVILGRHAITATDTQNLSHKG